MRIAALVFIAVVASVPVRALREGGQQPAAPPAGPPPAPVPAVLASYKPVTPERLKHPDDGDWGLQVLL